MATVTELKIESRIGGVRGQHGAENLQRGFHVVTNLITDDPSYILQTTSGGVVLGSGHPWGAFGVVVIGFRERERIDDLNWVVDALYGPPLVIDPTRPWDISIDVSLDTYTAFRDLDNQVIGPAVYHPVPDPDQFTASGLSAELLRLRDKRNFDTDGPLYFAVTSENGNQKLYRAKNDARRAVGFPRTRKVATFTLSRRLPRLQASQLAAVQSMVNTVNSSVFFGAPIECAKFVGMRTRSGDGIMIGQIVPNVTFDCELVFVIDWDSHNPRNEYDVYEHSDGGQSIITNASGKAIVREYRLYEELEFNTILSWLDR